MIKKVVNKNGTYLAYADEGDRDGFPILIQHGLIASIKDQSLFTHLINGGARVISIARPGYGESSVYELGNIGEWGNIVADLVAQLGLAQFDVLGISSGAPYSYAIGYALPDKARNIYILSGTPALYNEQVLACWPYPVDKNASLAEMQTLAQELFFSHLTPEDLEKDDIKDSRMNNCFGIGQDFKIRCKDWGFQLSEVKARVWMRHSRADEAVPLAAAEITARLLHNCRLEIRENDSHFSQEVLDHFIDAVVLGKIQRE